MRTDNVASFIRTALWGPSLPFSTHPLLVISRLREPRDCSILSFIHSPRDSFHFSSLALTSPRNKNLPGGRETRGGGQRCRRAVSPFAPSAVISLKSNCTRKNGSPLSGKRIARLKDGRLSHAYNTCLYTCECRQRHISLRYNVFVSDLKFFI